MNLNHPRIDSGKPLTDADFRPTRFERIAAAPFAVVLGILGAVALIHWMMS